MLKKIFEQLFSFKKDSDKLFVRLFGIKIKLKLPVVLKNDFIYKDMISKSPYWDALWYVQKYGHNFTRYEALEYWYNEGWKNGESPSRYINVEYCAPFCKGINPIIAYQNKQMCFFPDCKNNYKEENDFERIQEYLEYKKTRKAKSVVYTCITNDYDDLHEIEIYKYIDKDWDYVCFSDNEQMIKQGQLGIWEVKPLQFDELDNTRNNRWHKLLPHKLFPQYEESIYIDSNINIISDFLFRTVRESNKNFIQPRHFKNMCIYQEYEDVMKAKLDDIELIKKELNFIREAGMPRNYGFGENNVLYRKHNDEKMIKIDEEWWYMVSNFAKRDQLSLAYLLWKYGIKLESSSFENTRFQMENFYVFGHKKGRG